MSEGDTDVTLGDGPRSAVEYDAMADSYGRHNAVSGQMPTTSARRRCSFLGDVAGLRILSRCGTGVLTEWLV